MPEPLPALRLARLLAAGTAAEPGPAPPLPPEALPGLLAAADRHLAVPTLAGSLRRLELTAGLPMELAELLETLREANAARERALRKTLVTVAAALNAARIEPVLLKGANRLLDGLYPEPGLRFMGDLDLLVESEALPAAVAALEAQGWRPDPTRPLEDRAFAHQAPPLRHPGLPGLVELHRAPSDGAGGRLLPAADMRARAARVTVDGAIVRVPTLLDQLVHVTAHAQLHHGGRWTGRLHLRDGLDSFRLLHRGGQEAQAALLERLAAGGQARTAAVWLALVERLFGPLPAMAPATGLLGRAEVARFLAQERHGWLRRTGAVLGCSPYLAALVRSYPELLRGLPARMLGPRFWRRRARDVRRLAR